jgi:hypothetical protein
LLFVLAEKLSMTIGDLRRRMDYGEYVAWISYLELEAFERAEAQRASRR